MNSLKTMLLVAILASVAYGVYVTINGPAATPPPGAPEDWQSGPPSVSLPEGMGEAPGFSLGGLSGHSPSSHSPSGMPPSAADTADLAPPVPISADMPAPPFQPAPLPPAVRGNIAPPATEGSLAGATPSEVAAPAAERPTGGAAPLPPPASQANPYPGMAAPLPAVGRPAVETLPAASQPPRADEIRPEFADFLASARRDLDQGRLAETLAILSARYGEPDQTEAEVAALTALLDQVAGSVIYSTEHWLQPAHVVRPGETLEQIAEQYNVPWELLAKINGVRDRRALTAGQQLKVVRGPFRAVVHLDSHEMVLWLEDLYAGRFPIGVGAEPPELEGQFTVREKMAEPVYHGPAGRVIAAGDPINPLGKLRIGLNDSVAIHGTNDPARIGSTGGPGSVCLADRDIDDVFDILSVGSQIVIRR
ncbi:MAG: LysM peptidoglycan-binding domain-containing protein [Pirellulaceae bacterium]|jgi:hypothetical protein|nr:LysM peptidoglycan-binding domain-containing protein [Thermoguttaceae bacterium]NLZ02142.1 LysM peptidoglycan-binding domain-containing protein [Pirellulaceae bacterium]